MRIPKIYDGRDKTFFLVSFERYASHTAINYSSRVPTAAERTGDFSSLCTGGFNASGLCQSGVQLYDPTSPVDASGNRTLLRQQQHRFRINGTGAALLAYLNPNEPTPPLTILQLHLHKLPPQQSPLFIVR